VVVEKTFAMPRLFKLATGCDCISHKRLNVFHVECHQSNWFWISLVFNQTPSRPMSFHYPLLSPAAMNLSVCLFVALAIAYANAVTNHVTIKINWSGHDGSSTDQLFIRGGIPHGN